MLKLACQYDSSSQITKKEAVQKKKVEVMQKATKKPF